MIFNNCTIRHSLICTHHSFIIRNRYSIPHDITIYIHSTIFIHIIINLLKNILIIQINGLLREGLIYGQCVVWGVLRGKHQFYLQFSVYNVLLILELAKLQRLPKHKSYGLKFVWLIPITYRFLRSQLFLFTFF